MSATLSVEDILNNIDFELLQGIVAQGELGQAVQALQQYQNKARVDVFRSIKPSDGKSEFARKQFQLNNMLIAFLYELTRVVQGLQVEIRDLPSVHVPASHARPLYSNRTSTQNPTPAHFGSTVSMAEWRSSEEIEEAMRPEALHFEFESPSIGVPVVRPLLTRLKRLYQRPAKFFTQLLSDRQASVNKIFGDRILYLENILQNQQTEIEFLKAQLSNGHDDEELPQD